MRLRTHNAIATAAIAAVLLAVQTASAASVFRPAAGRIIGIVTDGSRIPQMGASILLFDRQDRLASRALTDEKGTFSFDNLASGAYSVRVSLASFVPVLKNNILVQPGGRSLLNVTLAGLFSSIDLVYPGPEQRTLMSDDWKWVLRTSSATRPVLRLLPGLETDLSQKTATTVFSDTRGLVKVSAGEGGRVTSFGNESDLGTAFALATSLYGSNQLQVSGNFGYGSQSRMPSAGFRTSFSRNAGGNESPEVSLTMRQLFVPGRMGAALVGGANVPMLRTLSLSVDDSTRLTEALRFDYGFSLDSVTFFDRLNYFSPYGRLSYALSDEDTVEISFTSGVPRSDFASGSGAATEGVLQGEINALALFPRVSLRGGRAKVQRAESTEVGYRKVLGSRTFRAAAYREGISNAALTMAGHGLTGSGDNLPDLFSDSSVFNAGEFDGLGYMASMTQDMGENLNATLMFGSGTALIADREEFAGSPDALRSMIRHGRRRAVTTQVAGSSPWTGTHFVASYQWTDRRSATPTHFFMTQRTRAEAGLNVYIRQPIPTFLSLPVRLEASADLRNLLAQGYLPFSGAGGQRIYLMHTPRSFRGGLSFIF